MSPTDPTTTPTSIEIDAPTAELLPVEKHAEQLEVPAWLFAAARAHHNWPQGREMSEADFTAAIDETKGLRIGGPATQEKK